MKTPHIMARGALLALTALLLLCLPLPAGAQTSTRLVVSPALSSVQTGQSFTVQVLVQDVVNLFAYDIKLGFPAALLQVTAMRNGGFLDAGMLIGPLLNNTAGTAQLINSQVSPSPGRTGSGVLVEIDFTARANLGEGPLVILQADLTENETYQLIPAEWENGAARVCRESFCANVFLPLVGR